MFNRKRWLTSGVTLTAIAALALTGCSGAASGDSADSDKPIVIGSGMSLTGDFQITGTTARTAAEYAVKEINESGGLLGRQVKIDIRDDQSKADQAAVAFQDLANDVDVFLSPTGSNTAVAVLDFVERQQIPMVGQASASEQIDPVHDWVFQAPTSSADSGEQMAKYVTASGYKKVFAIVNQEEGGLVDAWQAMRSGLDGSGVDVAGVADVATTTTDYSAAIAQAQSSDADLIALMVAGGGAIAFTPQYAGSGIDVPVIANPGVAAGYFLAAGGENVEGMLVAATLPVVTDSLSDSKQKMAMSEMIAGFTAETGESTLR